MESPKAHSTSCPCKKMDCPRWGLCDPCREYHYAKGKKPACERKRYLKRISRLKVMSPWIERID